MTPRKMRPRRARRPSDGRGTGELSRFSLLSMGVVLRSWFGQSTPGAPPKSKCEGPVPLALSPAVPRPIESPHLVPRKRFPDTRRPRRRSRLRPAADLRNPARRPLPHRRRSGLRRDGRRLQRARPEARPGHRLEAHPPRSHVPRAARDPAARDHPVAPGHPRERLPGLRPRRVERRGVRLDGVHPRANAEGRRGRGEDAPPRAAGSRSARRSAGVWRRRIGSASSTGT